MGPFYAATALAFTCSITFRIYYFFYHPTHNMS